MRSGKSSSLPRHRRLRRTVAHLLFAIPTLSLSACHGEDDGCLPYEYTGDLTVDITSTNGGVITGQQCMQLCLEKKLETTSCQVVTSAVDAGTGGRTVLHCFYPAHGCLSDGRQPEGLQAPRVEARCVLGGLFARMAWLEAASVPAFLRLADELKAHGAPDALVRAARRSAGEEVRHRRAMEALARRHGAAVPEVEIAPFSSRSLEAMAVENAKEGCVRETFGAVVAGWQARSARDEQVRAELSRIAEDELRHAELAWAVDAWAERRLAPAELQRVRAARLEAFHELERLVRQEEPEAVLIQQAGLPSRDAALHLLQGLQVLMA